jgi:alpha-1,6-mannosyltransferase
MIFLDINTFFSDRGGGIRTYHRAKIDWFQQHPEHTYYVVRPGPRYREERLADNVTLVEAFGIRTGDAYRFLLDYARVLRLIRRVRPDVIEAGDPWLTGAFTIAVRRLGLYRGLLSSFYHGDTVRTWIVPWADRPGVLRPLRRLAAGIVGWGYYLAQRMYDVTIVTSGVMERHLREQGVENVVLSPLGVDAIYFARPPAPHIACRPDGPGRASARSDGDQTRPNASVRLLFAGRLGHEKGTPLLLEIMPRLLALPTVALTVIGRGEFERELAAIVAPNYCFGGFVADKAEVARIYRTHDVLLAPGPYETFGLGILEGLASGMVVVGPDAGGAGEMLGEIASPFRFAAGDAAGFLEAIERAIHCDLAAEARRSRAAAARYGDWQTSFRRLIGYYQSMAGGPDSTPAPSFTTTQSAPAARAPR